jgi:hypothetical protein
LNPDQIKRREEARDKLGPADRKIKALEDIADSLTNIYLELVSRRPLR